MSERMKCSRWDRTHSSLALFTIQLGTTNGQKWIRIRGASAYRMGSTCKSCGRDRGRSVYQLNGAGSENARCAKRSDGQQAGNSDGLPRPAARARNDKPSPSIRVFSFTFVVQLRGSGWAPDPPREAKGPDAADNVGLFRRSTRRGRRVPRVQRADLLGLQPTAYRLSPANPPE